MLILVIVLALTTVAALGALVWLYVQPIELPGPDEAVAAALDRSPRPAGATGTRRMISIEILNPIELAGTRGFLASLAGTFAPGLTRRIVYDQTLKIIKAQLVEQHVVADVRIHTLRPVEPARGYTDEVERVDLDEVDETDLPDASGTAAGEPGQERPEA